MFSKTYAWNRKLLWEQANTIPFDELILSFNGIRPTKGKWIISVSLSDDLWLPLAEWGKGVQRTFDLKSTHFKVYQDAAIPFHPKKSFKIKVSGDEIEKLDQMWVSLSLSNAFRIYAPKSLQPVHLKKVIGCSQFRLKHPRNKDLCSPTSVTIAANFMCPSSQLNPTLFAEQVKDQTFDIFGNWTLNLAECYNKTQIPCFVKRLSGFEELHQNLMQNRPVVVSIKGPIKGGALPYQFGHLICVTGYSQKKVFCIDPAFASDETTQTFYEIDAFLEAWGRKKNLAYLFNP